MKFPIIVTDPCWQFKDKLRQSSTKRGADDHYKTLTNSDIINLNVKELAADDSVLALWVPGSFIDVGIECCKAYGFKPTQTWIWVKSKKNPLEQLEKKLRNEKNLNKDKISEIIKSFDLNDTLKFYMGHCFRQCHEIAIIGTRGKYKKLLKNKSQRSVNIYCLKDIKHSRKPEELQNRLDLMFPGVDKLEMFARRDRPDWNCCGNECPSTWGEDVRDSILRLIKL